MQSTSPKPRTLFEKVWDAHVIVTRGANEALLSIDNHFVHEGSFHAFGALAKEGRRVRKPRQVFGSPDHFVPTTGRDRGLAGIADAESRALLGKALREIADRLDRDEPDADSGTLGDSIRGAVERFEGEHPELVSAVARVAEALGAAGI